VLKVLIKYDIKYLKRKLCSDLNNQRNTQNKKRLSSRTKSIKVILLRKPALKKIKIKIKNFFSRKRPVEADYLKLDDLDCSLTAFRERVIGSLRSVKAYALTITKKLLNTLKRPSLFLGSFFSGSLLLFFIKIKWQS